MNIVGELLLGMMRKSGAIRRTHLVDATIVRLQIEELARLCFIEPVPAAVLAQPFLLEIIGFHLQKAGDASDIRRCIGG